jgi:hypothetical protein
VPAESLQLAEPVRCDDDPMPLAVAPPRRASRWGMVLAYLALFAAMTGAAMMCVLLGFLS